MRAEATSLTTYRSPKNTIRRFIAKKSTKSGLILGIILGLYFISKTTSFLKAYPTDAARQKLAETLGANIGVEALLGVAHHIETVAGYLVWNFLCLVAAAGAIWALLTANKYLRGEEDAGRLELFLAGQTSAKAATIKALFGLYSGVASMFLAMTIAILAISKMNGAHFMTSSSLFFALALSAGAAEFIAVGALTSQLMPSRARANGVAALVFAVFYMIRLIADTTSATWLLNVSPLGWIEKLQPMYGSRPIWLLPIAAFILILCGLSIHLAGKRDLGEATFAEKANIKPRFKLLTSPTAVSLRLTKVSSIGWLVGIAVASFVYGLLAKGAATSLGSTASTKHYIEKLAHSSNPGLTTAFMGVTFLLVMVLIMNYVIHAVSHLREDEGLGYVDNFLVRPVSRSRWLSGQVVIVVVMVAVAGLLSGLMSWLGQAAENGGVSLHTLILAGINAAVPALAVMSLGILGFGFFPRLTSYFTYGILGWSFLLAMLSSGLNINHWLLDTSLLHQVVLAPAVSPNWTANSVITTLSLVGVLLGTYAFNKRDLAKE